MACCDNCAQNAMMASAAGFTVAGAAPWGVAAFAVRPGSIEPTGPAVAWGPSAELTQRRTLGGYVLPEIRVAVPFGRAILASGPCAGGDDRHLVGQGDEREPWVWTPATIRPYLARVGEEWDSLNRDVRDAALTGDALPWKQRFSAAYAQFQAFRTETNRRLDNLGLGFPGFAGYSDMGNETRNWQTRNMTWRAEFRALGHEPTGPDPEPPETPELPLGSVGEYTGLVSAGAVLVALLLAAFLLR